MIVSAEKGNKAVACISVHGVYVPPMLRLFHGAQLRSIGFCSPSGSINTELFVKWLQPFVSHSEASFKRNDLLILDNHQNATYLIHEIQNDLIQSISFQTMLKIVNEIKVVQFFDIIVDSTVDIGRTSDQFS